MKKDDFSKKDPYEYSEAPDKKPRVFKSFYPNIPKAYQTHKR